MLGTMTAKILKTLLAGLAAFTLTANLAAATERPRIGLVLGGGGARGAAHIGVLEVLREERVPVDCIAGTSMGGLVSGAFAAGLSPEEMLEALGQADWRDMFKDLPATADINPRKRNLSRRFIPGTEMGVTAEGPTTLPSVVDGQKIKLFINQLVRNQYGEPQIEKLPLPLSIVATDLVSGEKVAFRAGSLTKAMRSTMSVPGLMAPISDGKRLLVDGGLVDNVPIDEVRRICRPDVVIAINVGSPLMKAEDIGGIFSVAGQMVNILTEQNVTKSLATLQPDDIYIKPDLEGITAGDFERYAEAAKRGRAAAEASRPKLRALGVDAQQYQAWLAQATPARSAQEPVVDAVEIAGLKRVNPQYVERHLRDYEGAPLDVARVNRDMGIIYGDEEYRGVDYAMVPVRDKNILRVTPLEKEFGPDYLRFGVNLHSVSAGPSAYNFRVAYQKTWLNSLGGEWLAGVQVGNELGAFTEFYQPLDAEQRFFLEPRLYFMQSPISVYQNNQQIAEYKISQVNADVVAGINFGVLGHLSGGWGGRQRRTELQVGLPLSNAEGDSKHFDGLVATLNLEQFDSLYNPARGWSAKASYFNATGENYSKGEVELRAAHNVGNYVFQGRLYGAGSLTGTLPFYDAVSLGGFLNLSGFARYQIVGDTLAYGNLRAEKIVGRLPLGLRGDMRVGMALEAGRVDGRYTETRLDGWQNSLTVYAGGETPLGMAFLGFGYAPNGMSNVYLFIGTP